MQTKRVEMAAVHRLLQREGLNEGIDNLVSLGLGDGANSRQPRIRDSG
jgi:hypothetical protein